jgi:hypothetical protein
MMHAATLPRRGLSENHHRERRWRCALPPDLRALSRLLSRVRWVVPVDRNDMHADAAGGRGSHSPPQDW